MQTDQIYIGEAAAEIIFQLRREIDFRHQQQYLPAASQDIVHQVHIHLGLAAAGDTVQQETSKSLRCCNGINRLLLFSGECVRIVEHVFCRGYNLVAMLHITFMEQRLELCSCRWRKAFKLHQTARLLGKPGKYAPLHHFALRE